MTPNPTSADPAQQESNRTSSGIANVFRNFGRLNRSGFSIPSVPLTPTSNNENRSSAQLDYFPVDPAQGALEIVAKLKQDRPLQDRIAAAEALKTVIADFPQSVLTEIWFNAQDLIDKENPNDARQAAFRLLAACIEQHSEPSALDRLRYYRTIAQHDDLNDFYDQLEAMKTLTSGGRDLSSFEREIGGLLSRWLKTWFQEATKARTSRKRDGKATDNLSGEEFCLRELFKFVTDIIKFNFQAFQEPEINQLLTDVLSICRRTTNKADIESSIAFIEALITYGYIPPASLKPCVEILCGSYATLRDLADATWSAVSNLCKSHMAHKCILVLLDILRSPAQQPAQPPNTNTLRGAVWFLEKLLIADDESGLPHVQVSVVMPAFRDALTIDSMRLGLEICRAIASILATKDPIAQITYEEWTIPLEILTNCAKKTIERADGTSLVLMGVQDVPHLRSQDKELSTAISQVLFQIINRLHEVCRDPNFGQLEDVIEFFMGVHGHIPEGVAELVIEYYASEHLCYPSCSDWLTNSRRLIDVFFKNRLRPSEMRIKVLSLIKDVYETIREVSEEGLLHELVMVVFDDIRTEQDPKVLEALVKITVDVAGDTDMDMFNKLIGILTGYIGLDPLSTEPSPTSGSGGGQNSRPISGVPTGYAYGSLVNIVTRGLVKMFIRNINVDAAKAVRLYEELTKIAGSPMCEVDARLTAMKLLFRLRSDSGGAVFITDTTESDYLAGVLNRTAKSPDERDLASITSSSRTDEEYSSSRSGRSNSISQSLLFRQSGSNTRPVPKTRRRNPLWGHPELRPLPEKPPSDASPVLSTFHDYEPDIPSTEDSLPDPTTSLKMSLWVEQIIPIVQQGCDWEIFSYVLVHLPSQLSNRTTFRHSKAQIGILRNYVCSQLHTTTFPNIELPADVKKADIAVSLIHLLTVLVSYREIFARNETEGIVKAFQLGLHSWTRTAKPCIHALSICCYELPGALSKFLSGILSKLATIITSPVVSVHILEFLAALAKMPELYRNFTEPDFRNIFGIAFRYIQHVKESAREHSQSRSNSHGRLTARETPEVPQEQSDVPQYVLTLAYNVLTTWFLSLRLSERPKYVSWITRGLVVNDHSNQIDEQSEACIDMLQRFTYSDYELKPPAKLDTQSSHIVTKNWVNGMTILSMQTAPSTGFSRITVRRPACTTHFSLKPESRDLIVSLQSKWMDINEIHDDSGDIPITRVLPSDVLLQFAGGIGIWEQSRPILLPDDDKTQRALDVFDRIPVVDFHKIGVVYVGAGQTEEQEILANAMGSPDYTDFVDGLGELVTLKNAEVNTGGLDREGETDGQFMYLWRDRTTEIAFHVTTMMPTRDYDPACTMKKQHIGNDFVNIVFNNSGLPWQFGTIPSQFNFVSIVISPEARSSFVSSRLLQKGPEDTTFYRVQVCCKEGFSDISPAQEPKMVSARCLPSFVRNIALNASVYSHVFNEGGGEHISSIRHRLRSIKQLRERVGAPPNRATSPAQGQSAVSARRVSSMSTQTASTDHSLRSSQMNGENDRDTETEDLLMSLDFSRFT